MGVRPKQQDSLKIGIFGCNGTCVANELLAAKVAKTAARSPADESNARPWKRTERRGF
jgi:hypothetical protein